MDLKFKLVWIFVALAAMISTVNCGGNTYEPPATIPDEPISMSSIPSISMPSIPIPSIELGPPFDDIDHNPSNPSLAPNCVYPYADILKSEFKQIIIFSSVADFIF